MNINRIKLFAIAIITVPLFAVSFLHINAVSATTLTDDETATTYKTKCQACHTATASKFFDPAKEDAVHVEVILKGKKGEKPPFMPGFETKGMTEAQAKALAEYMRALRTPSD